jgi:putative DNA primase/helicase
MLDITGASNPTAAFEASLLYVAATAKRDGLGTRYVGDKMHAIAEAAGLVRLHGNDWVQERLVKATAKPAAERSPTHTNGDKLDLPSPAFSDESLALIFAANNANKLRYVAQLGKWMIWDGTRWRYDETLIARHLVREVCRTTAGCCNQKKLAKQIASAKTVAAVERLAQADRDLAATVDQWDCDPWLLNTPRGTIDLRTGIMHAHREADYLTRITSVEPDTKCPIPNWRSFLRRITNHNAELELYLQRMGGYCLTGLTSEHALFFCYGTGANGKTTLVNAVTGSIGDYHRTAPIETFTQSHNDRHPTELAALRGARLVTAVETEEGRRWAESKIKALTGGDAIATRYMRQDFFEYTPQFKLLIAGNHKPGLRSVDEAIRRRFNLLPFTVTIPLEERDETLPDKLMAELPGILAWAVQGCAEWRQQSLNPPKIVTDATAAYLEAEDAMNAWLDECIDRDAQSWTLSAQLFGSWSAWANRSGEHVGSQKRLSQQLEDKGFTPRRDRLGRGFTGLRIKL